MKKKLTGLSVAAVIVFLAVYYYVTLPAINIHSEGTWMAMILVVVCVTLFVSFRQMKPPFVVTGRGIDLRLSDWKRIKVFRIGLIAAGALLIVYLIGSLLSSPVINAGKYQKLLNVQEGEFTSDIQQISYKQIPLLDKDSAMILGNRKMGSLVDLASQFEVSPLYSQINYKGNPVRVTPLRYASAIKWFTNMKNGIPAYILIDMATQNTQLVRLPEGMRYTPYDHFQRNLYRHLRFRYPTYIFNDISFEIDEEGVPVWVCSVAKFNIGLFGGQTVSRVVVCNAVTGECIDYSVEEVPTWIDRAYPADLLVQLYDYYGTLKHGFINSVLGQRDCLQTTNGYNYLAINDDVWVYTGVTSITGDQSNVGFVLMNQRTMETRYYQVEGAIEDSAMSSAEGKVQNLEYIATFPLLLNINGEPTYFIALKDNSGLVKMFAMVNVQKYQVVATGDSVSACEKNYIALLKENGIHAYGSSDAVASVTGTIARLAEVAVEGNTHYYILLEGDSRIFDVTVAECIDVIRYGVGEKITLEYMEGEETCTVLSVGE